MLFGISVGHDPIYDPNRLAKAGVRLVRIVLQKHVNLTDYIGRCHAHGIKVLGVIARESIAGFGGVDPYREAALYYARTYPFLDYIQVGNEPDNYWWASHDLRKRRDNSPSSWVMDQPDLNHLLRVFAQAWSEHAPDARRVVAGASGGDPRYWETIDTSAYHFFALHPYTKWPHDVREFIESYRSVTALPFVVTEFSWPSPDRKQRGEYLYKMGIVFAEMGMEFFAWYCWDEEQNPGFGILDHGQETATYKWLVKLLQDDGWMDTQKPVFVLGFKDAHEADPTLVGAPLENERGGVPYFSQQKTETGVLTWAKLFEGEEVITLYHQPTLTRQRFDPGRKLWAIL